MKTTRAIQRSLFVLCLMCATSAHGWEPKSAKDCRLAFLVGMTSFTGHAPSVPVFPTTGDDHKVKFDEIARQYATDLGVPAELLRTTGWRDRLTAAIAGHFGTGSSHRTIEELFDATVANTHRVELEAAYLAGAYVAHGTPTGFQLTNQRKGLYLAWLIRATFPGSTIEITIRPGIPGNITITVRHSEPNAIQAFFEDLETVRRAIARGK